MSTNPNLATDLARVMGPKVSADMNGALCAFAMRWELDGDYIRCRKCTSPQLTTYSDREFLHHPGCKAAGTVETHPWRTYLELLAPLIAAWNTRAASGGDSASLALERFGRGPAGSPYLLVPMDDGYWTPWHIAQKALDESRLNEPFGNAEQLASLEQQARALFEAQADPLAAPWDRQWEPTKQYWRNKAAALANQQGVGDQ